MIFVKYPTKNDLGSYIIIFLSLLLVFIGNDILIHYQIDEFLTEKDVLKTKICNLKILNKKKLRSPCIISEYLDDKYPYIQKNSIEESIKEYLKKVFLDIILNIL